MQWLAASALFLTGWAASAVWRSHGEHRRALREWNDVHYREWENRMAAAMAAQEESAESRAPRVAPVPARREPERSAGFGAASGA